MLVVRLVAVGLLLIARLTGNGSDPGSEYITYIYICILHTTEVGNPTFHLKWEYPREGIG